MWLAVDGRILAKRADLGPIETHLSQLNESVKPRRRKE